MGSGEDGIAIRQVGQSGIEEENSAIYKSGST